MEPPHNGLRPWKREQTTSPRRFGIDQRRPAEIILVLDAIRHSRFEEETAVSGPGDERDSGLGEDGPEKAQGRQDDEKVAQSAPADRQDRFQSDAPAGRAPSSVSGGESRLCLTAEKGKMIILGRMKVFSSRLKKTLTGL
jgi:hypothetical protein